MSVLWVAKIDAWIDQNRRMDWANSMHGFSGIAPWFLAGVQEGVFGSICDAKLQKLYDICKFRCGRPQGAPLHAEEWLRTHGGRVRDPPLQRPQIVNSK